MFNDIYIVSELWLTAIVLIVSVMRIRAVIKNTKFAQPNDRLVMVHCTNFCVWGLLQISLVFIMKYEAKTLKNVFWEFVFMIFLSGFLQYIRVFLLYLIIKFVKESR